MFESRAYQRFCDLANRPGTTTALFEKIIADLTLKCSDNKNLVFECKPRDQRVLEILDYSVAITQPADCIIHSPARKINKAYLLSEFVWYLSGDPNPDMVSTIAPFWNQIRDDKGLVSSNYGQRIWGVHPYFQDINQFENVMRTLIADKDSRQAVMTINAAPDLREGNKDVPCTFSLQFLIRRNTLHMIVNMRSNDIIMGFGNDVFQFSMIMQMVRAEYNRRTNQAVKLGTYYHNAGSMHLYERHWNMAEDILEYRAFNDSNRHEQITYDEYEGQMPASTYLEDKWYLIELESQLNAGTDGLREKVSYEMLEDSGAFRSLHVYWQNMVKQCWGVK